MATVVLNEMFLNYSSYCIEETGKLWKSSPNVGAEGVEFMVRGQRRQNQYTRYVLNFWDADCVGRDVHRGPVAQRASATLSAQASVIAAHPLPEPPVIEVGFGDLIVYPALDLVVRVEDGGRFADPVATILNCQLATVDHHELVLTTNAQLR